MIIVCMWGSCWWTVLHDYSVHVGFVLVDKCPPVFVSMSQQFGLVAVLLYDTLNVSET